MRELRQKLHQQRRDAVRQADRPDREDARRRGQDGREWSGEDDRRDRRGPPRGAGGFMLPFASGDVVQDSGDRVIVRRNGQLLIRSDSETDRLLRRARDVSVDELGGGRTRTIVTRSDGIRVITERDYDGEIIRRVRQYPDGDQVVLIDERGYDHSDRAYEPGYFERSLPPLDLQMPQDRYIVEMQRASEGELEDTLMAPPVESVERVYTLEEVRDSSRLRDKLRRVDLDAITFDTGSAAISRSQIGQLSAIGQAIEDVVSRNPNEIFLVEGHTDAIGSDVSNLALSDRRAESVAIVLSENFDIPPENLVTQGYGEQYLKVPTETAERANRRVAVRRITPLIQSTSR
ncbi:outer membrane protein OmpA-like peptidoglycan-associated protein [Rhodopseudomonas julia]|uniref:Outer membrane protein OmpA-like peptidoglycan-associated protein n=1 Tax=Rhodopseudomonas julia TaxID=200617 RepID=A0ABU0C919_9BRAD|nr:OmpA family protein [Rhodopseudomonas julia]MDQ0327016.1 outer membrane protein OmpA-like peptidoglycan-associated protein [Rhodopseudomonas julia]